MERGKGSVHRKEALLLAENTVQHPQKHAKYLLFLLLMFQCEVDQNGHEEASNSMRFSLLFVADELYNLKIYKRSEALHFNQTITKF